MQVLQGARALTRSPASSTVPGILGFLTTEAESSNRLQFGKHFLDVTISDLRLINHSALKDWTQ